MNDFVQFFINQGYSEQEAKQLYEQFLKQNSTTVSQAKPQEYHNPYKIPIEQKKRQDRFHKNKNAQADALTFGMTPHKNQTAANVGAENIAENLLWTIPLEGLNAGVVRPVIRTFNNSAFGTLWNMAHNRVPLNFNTQLQAKVIRYTKNPEPIARFDLFQRPSKLSAAEKQGLPKVNRSVVRHSEPSLPYVDYSLINKHYEPWIVDETGHFILKSPEESHRLSTVHFTFNSPVTTHSGGSWEDAPTVLMLPYRNVRSQTAPVDMAIYDTFFPNYNGLKISTKGAKILTGDRPTFQYYKSKGLDVEFSPEMESLLNELKVLKTKYAQLPLEKRGAVRGQYEDVDALNDMINEISGKIDKIARNWTIQHRTPIPNYEKVNELGAAEGYDVKNYPFQFATPIRQNLYGPRVLNSEGLDYNWVSDPTNHAAALQTPEYILQDYGDELRPEYRKYIEWLINHKADYRAFGGKLIKRIRK